MPGKSPIFTPSSILFRPQQKPSLRRFLVEAPGTALYTMVLASC